jgi:hypothetical protein
MTTLINRLSMTRQPPPQRPTKPEDRDRERERDQRRYQAAIQEVEELETLARAYGCHPCHD